MSVEFRQRTPGEYLRILWRRKWAILLPTVVVAVAVAYVVWRLPDVYESTSLLIVRPPTIASAFIPRLSEEDLSLRINNISQEVLSRSVLQPLIERYDLYVRERRNGEPMEAIIERMRRDVRIQIESTRDTPNAFRISYRGNDPRATQAVAAELASKYVNAQMKATTATSTQTKEFFEQRLAEAKRELDEIDMKRIEFMQRNVGNLPSEAQALVGQLAGLREQQKALIAEIGRLRDQRTVLNNQLSDLIEQSERDRADIVERLGDPKESLAYAQLAQRKAQLEAEKQNMLTVLKPKNPDVIAKQAEIDAVQREMDKLVEEGRAKREEVRKKIEGRPDLRINSYRAQLKLLDGELERLQRRLADTESQISMIEGRLNQVPNAEVGLEALNREYQTRKAQYDDLLQKKEQAMLAADVAANAQGETIQVIDPANYPEKPVAPKRPVLMGFGVALGLGLGLLLAALLEVPRLLTIQTVDDAEHYTGLPVLVTVPEIYTPQEERRLRLRRAMLAAASLVATVLSIPALILLLRATRIFERLTS